MASPPLSPDTTDRYIYIHVTHASFYRGHEARWSSKETCQVQEDKVRLVLVVWKERGEVLLHLIPISPTQVLLFLDDVFSLQE